MNICVVDTNVPKQANATEDVAEACKLACIEFLVDIMANGRVAVDAQHHAFDEYRRHLNDQGQPGVGDKFLRWLYTHRSPDPGSVVLEVNIFPQDIREPKAGYHGFPVELSGLDPSDKKWVCIYQAANADAIVVSADRGWEHWGPVLAGLGVVVRHMCPK